jgi:MFS family permease
MTTRLRQRWLLAVLVAGQFMANVDIAIVNVATPSIHRDLHASGGALEFVVSGYVLAFAMLIITGARLGRIAGYRRVYLAGLAGFTLASLACSLAPGTGALIGARIAQGACAAVMVPQVLTGIQVSFDGRARARALSVLVMTMSGSAVIGQALGGPLIAADAFGTGWRSIFWVNVPVGVVTLAGAAVLLPRAGRDRPARLDLPGVGLLTAAMALLVTPLAFGREQGWPAWTWACLGASVVAFAGFAAFERRLTARGGDPVINLRLLARPVVTWELTANFARTSTYFAMLFVLAQYLQQGLGRSATYSGLVLVSWVAAFGIAAPVTRRLPARVAPFGGVLGSLILASAFAAVSAAPAPGPFLIVALGAGGFGLGMAYSSLLGHLTAAVPPDEAADLSGLVNTSAQVAAVAGVAAYGTVYFALAARPAYAFAVVTATLAASGFAGAACSFLSARRRVAEVSTAPSEERLPARAR